MPVYNTEAYVPEAIDSLVRQSVGFESAIQLVLVNDGSTDGSERVCLEYANRYPGNVIYRYQENAGVSAARNTGLAYAEGRYIAFLDSDDAWAEDAFEKARDFLSEHDDEIDMVSCRIGFFGGREGYHVTDDKYKRDRIVDLREKFWMINTTIGNTFIKAEALKGLSFDERLTVNEDVLLLAEVLSRNPRYGTLRSALFRYRRREGTEALTSIKDDPQRYLPQLRLLLDALRGLGTRAGDEARFIAYTRAYFILWLVRTESNSAVLAGEGSEEYESYLADQLGDIGLEQLYRHHRGVHASYKAYLYRLKYGKDVFREAEERDGKLYYDGAVIYNFSLPGRVIFRGIRREAGRYLLEGETDLSVAGVEGTVRAMPAARANGGGDAGGFGGGGGDDDGGDDDGGGHSDGGGDDGYDVTVRYDSSLDRYVSSGRKVMDGVILEVSLPAKNGAELALTATYAGKPVSLGFRVDGGEAKRTKGGTEYFEHGDCLIVYLPAGAAIYRNDYFGRRELNKSRS